MTDSKSFRILIVDDEPVLRRSLSRMIEKMGATALVAGNGADALQQCSIDATLSVVLLDVRLPGMSGFTALRRLRQLRPTLPVVVMSGDASARLPSDLARDPKVQIIDKPFDRAALSAVLRQLIDRKCDEVG